MHRIQFAAQCVSKLNGVARLLDVGCRDCELKEHLPNTIGYIGLDLQQNRQGTVAYVGDVMSVLLNEQFDCIVAMDVLEHVDNPGLLFDRLLGLARNYLLISLPNCYDLKSRVKFALGGNLGGKYVFTAQSPVDRHRWLMGRREILSFYTEKARQHRVSFQSADLLYGDFNSPSWGSKIRALSRLVLPRTLCTSTVFGIFSKQSL
jgi:2-polyprenyl-3-methyl-5-hydroxy-6-metoxy-1,4-benzoquinol methylase